MRTILISSLLLASVAFLTQGCAAENASDNNEEGAAADLSSGSVTGAHADVLADLLAKAKAPSSTPAGITGVGSHIARVEVDTAQGGIAHFISESGTVSTVAGEELGNFVDLGASWVDVRDALTAGGAKFVTTEGLHGASSSKMLATVECRQVVSPTARPTCTVTPITLTAADNAALMQVLVAAHAPSTDPAGTLGVDDLAASFELTFAQGGIAHFISQGGTISTLDGKKLGDVVDFGVAWQSIETALLDGGATAKTTQGQHGASSSTTTATVQCHRVVAPQARATCTVSSF
jgi:hypothetical protein